MKVLTCELMTYVALCFATESVHEVGEDKSKCVAVTVVECVVEVENEEFVVVERFLGVYDGRVRDFDH